jgi:hypothetical protein
MNIGSLLSPAICGERAVIAGVALKFEAAELKAVFIAASSLAKRKSDRCWYCRAIQRQIMLFRIASPASRAPYQNLGERWRHHLVLSETSALNLDLAFPCWPLAVLARAGLLVSW